MFNRVLNTPLHGEAFTRLIQEYKIGAKQFGSNISWKLFDKVIENDDF